MATFPRFQGFAQDDGGNSLASPNVEVRLESTGALATLYSDRAGATPIANPFTGDSDGFFAFHVAGGAYKITVTKDATTRTFRYVGISQASEFANVAQSSAGNIGIGTPNPGGQFEVSNLGDATNCAWLGGGINIVGSLDNSCNIYCSAVGTAAQTLVEWLWYRTRGTPSTPTALMDGDVIGQFQIAGRDGSGSIASTFGLGANYAAQCLGNWSGSNHGCKLVWAVTPQSSTALTQAMVLHGSGGLAVGSSASDPGAASILAQGEVRADGDTGGQASTNALTGTSDLTTNSSGVGSIKFKGATSRDSAGFIKIYVGTTAYYVPVFSAISG